MIEEDKIVMVLLEEKIIVCIGVSAPLFPQKHHALFVSPPLNLKTIQAPF